MVRSGSVDYRLSSRRYPRERRTDRTGSGVRVHSFALLPLRLKLVVERRQSSISSNTKADILFGTLSVNLAIPPLHAHQLQRQAMSRVCKVVRWSAIHGYMSLKSLDIVVSKVLQKSPPGSGCNMSCSENDLRSNCCATEPLDSEPSSLRGMDEYSVTRSPRMSVSTSLLRNLGPTLR
jgi:hypothetical protein